MLLQIFTDLYTLIKEEIIRKRKQEETPTAEPLHSDNNLDARVTVLEQKLLNKQPASIKTGLTTPESIFVFRYLFIELGIDRTNLNKTKIAQLLSVLTGKSENCIRQELSKLPDDRKAKRMAEKFEPYFRPIFPEIAEKMKNDYREI